MLYCSKPAHFSHITVLTVSAPEDNNTVLPPYGVLRYLGLSHSQSEIVLADICNPADEITR